MNKAGVELQNTLRDSKDPAAAFATWRRSYSTSVMVDASGLSLNDIDLSGTDWTNIILDSAKFIGCTFDNATFGGDHGSLYKALFKGGSYKDVKIQDIDCRYLIVQTLHLDGARFTDKTVLDNAQFQTVSLESAKFDRCRLAGTIFKNCSVDNHTLFENLISTTNMHVDQSMLDSLKDRGGLTEPQLSAMVITDEIRELRARFGGMNAWLYVLSLLIFLFPYIAFIAGRLIQAAIRDASPSDIPLYDALWAFLLTAGDDWQTRPIEDIAWVSVVIVIFVSLYNIGRLVLVLNVFRLERHELIARRRSHYFLKDHQRLSLLALSIGYRINLGLIAVNTAIFFATPVPL